EAGEAVLIFPAHLGKYPEPLSVGRALSEAAPGNISKRYAVRRSELGYWHPLSERLLEPPATAPAQVGAAELFSERMFVGVSGGVRTLEPRPVRVIPVTRTVRDTGKGSWVWQVGGRHIGDGMALPVLPTPTWRGVFAECVAYLHRDYGRLEVLRYGQQC